MHQGLPVSFLLLCHAERNTIVAMKPPTKSTPPADFNFAYLSGPLFSISCVIVVYCGVGPSAVVFGTDTVAGRCEDVDATVFESGTGADTTGFALGQFIACE